MINNYKTDAPTSIRAHTMCIHTMAPNVCSLISGYYANSPYYFNTFVEQISAGSIKYILDLPYFLFKNTKQIDFEIIEDYNAEEIIYEGEDERTVRYNPFFYYLVKYAIYTEEDSIFYDPLVAEAALRSLAVLSKLDSVTILHYIIKTEIMFSYSRDNEKIQIKKSLLQELPNLATKAKSPVQIISILMCVSSLCSAFTENIENIFLPFFINNLHSNDRQIRFSAAKEAFSIICGRPSSEFSFSIMKELPYDPEDIEISKFCFHSLAIQCQAGNFQCFDVPQIIQFLKSDNNRKDALYVLAAATANEDICRSLLPYVEVFDSLFDIVKPKFVCLIITNIVSKGHEFVYPFVPILLHISDVYSSAQLDDKIEISRTIGMIICYGHLEYAPELNEVYNVLIDSLDIPDTNMNITALDALQQINLVNEEFHQALFRLIDNDNQLISLYADKICRDIDNRHNE